VSAQRSTLFVAVFLAFWWSGADQFGAFELLTLPEPHRVRVSAPGYCTTTVDVGRVWFP
jgi:ABC-type nitrate/sulfonate/bicarbonate transport system permease component